MTVIESCDGTHNEITHEIYYLPTNASNETFVDCSWRVTVPTDRSVVLDIIDLQIESSINCEKASLEVFDGPNARFTRFDKPICGNSIQKTLESSSNEFYMTFISVSPPINQNQFTIKYSISGS